MIRKYTFGNPFPTEAVVKDIPASQGTLPYFTREDGSLVLTLEEGAPVYGLGEQVRGINKRGWTYTSNCSDDPHHLETTHSLYGAHNFLMIGGKQPFGIFIDYPGYLTFDIGYTRKDTLRITPADWDMDVYLIEAEDGRFPLHSPRLPTDDRQKLHPAEVGLRLRPEPLGLPKRGGCA